MRLLMLPLLAAGVVSAAGNQCVSEPEARAALQAWRDSKRTSSEQVFDALHQLAAKYPADYQIQSERISFCRLNYRWHDRAAWPSVRDAYVKRAEEHPQDPVALTVAGVALYQTDTPRAIRFLTKAREIAPQYPWAALKLAEIYQTGKFADKDSARANFNAYAELCAEHIPSQADRIMGKVGDLQAQAAIARRLRARLDSEAEPQPEDYERLWALEFRTRPPAEHPGVRRQVSKDVERLLALTPDKATVRVALAGLKQSGASPDAVTAFEDRILREAAASEAAYGIAYQRWSKDHKEPEDHKDSAAWQAWRAAYLAALKGWAEQFKEVEWLKNSYTSARVEAGELDKQETIAYFQSSTKKRPNDMWTYANAGSELLKRSWSPERALEWMARAWPLAEIEDWANLDDDTLTDERRKEISGGLGYRGYVAADYLRALKLAGKKDVPSPLRAYLDGPMPAKKADYSRRYRALAWLASVDGRDADALAYFQKALFTREKAPQFYRGKREDVLLDEAKAAFLKTGGTEKAFALWSQPSGSVLELTEGRWEKPKKALPAFELADISGKTWKLKQLEGKAVLVNLWATWCGPCRAELPHLETLYQKTKGRSDLQVISFNVDEDVGLVEPFMKEKGYTFPALAAYTLVRGLYDEGYGIPQNWLVDPKGNWLATQMGFDASDADWVEPMLKRLEAARQGKAPAGIE